MKNNKADECNAMDKCTFLYYLWNGIKEKGEGGGRYGSGRVRSGNLAIFRGILSGYIERETDANKVEVMKDVSKRIEGNIVDGELKGREVPRINRILSSHRNRMYDVPFYNKILDYYKNPQNFAMELIKISVGRAKNADN